MPIGQAIQDRGCSYLVTLAAALVVFGCSGRPSVKEQYVKHSKEITEKYDGMLVPANAPLYGSKTPSCNEFIETLTKKYPYWKSGDTGTNFCASDAQSNKAERRKFEMHVRGMHNKGVSISKTKRLAHLQQLYKEAAKIDGGDEALPPKDQAAGAGATGNPQRVSGVRGVPKGRVAEQLERGSRRRGVAPVPVVKLEGVKDPLAPGKGGDQLPYAEDADEPVQAPTPVKAPTPVRAVAPAAKQTQILEPEPVVTPEDPSPEESPGTKDTPMSEYQD